MVKQNIEFRADLDFRELDENPSIEEIRKYFNRLANGVSFMNKHLSFQSNFDGNIVNVTIPAGEELQIQHFLGITPKYRIILRQVGDGVLTDVNDKWNDKIITLLNNGAVDVTATVLIARE